jgi:hypothetical protein
LKQQLRSIGTLFKLLVQKKEISAGAQHGE